MKKIKQIIINFTMINILLIIVLVLLLIQNSYNNNKPIIDIQLSHYELVLSLNEEKIIVANYKDVSWKSLDSNIIKVNNGKLIASGVGYTKVLVEKDNSFKEINITVTDLYTLPIINNDKDYLLCNEYTYEDNIFLDNILKQKIEEKGYKTRAGVVEAARFLTLSFPYKIHYFYENGRLLTNGTRKYVDGEGRYYHQGLYLSQEKTSELLSSLKGPSIWGCNLYSKPMGTYAPNGLDCSGFISWALLNGGFDVGDAGAGIDNNKINDLDDLGDKIIINEENIDEKNYKVGDLLSRDGHIGILIGVDNTYYYVAESLDYDLHIKTYNKEELLNSDWKYFINLNNLYIKEGVLNNMW